MVKEKTGVIAFLTPTSFLGGQYFTALRTLLTEKLLRMPLISSLTGMGSLTMFSRNNVDSIQGGEHKVRARVSSLVPKGLNKAKIEKIGNVDIEKVEQRGFCHALKMMPVFLMY